MAELTEWNSFYVIVGSSAGALIGLQFVVLTLIAERPHVKEPQAGAAFATPSVVHFAVVLFLSAILSAPWHGVGIIAVFLGVVGIAGIVYEGLTAYRMRSQTAYRPVFEDWLFHVLLPVVAYANLFIASLMARSQVRRALFFVAATVLMLLFIGIHNAWDAVTYFVFMDKGKRDS
jgi:hypothetical protein